MRHGLSGEKTQLAAQRARKTTAGDYVWGTGRRKTATARVRLRPGTGVIEVNGRDMEEFFPRDDHRDSVRTPLRVTKSQGMYDIYVSVRGGGITGQAEAISLGIARGLIKADSGTVEPLRDNGLLTRDSRMTERKKYGKRGARRSPQFSKR